MGVPPELPEQYLPGVHAMQSCLFLPLLFGLYVPGGHDVTFLEPYSQKPPVVQMFPVVTSVGLGTVAPVMQ